MEVEQQGAVQVMPVEEDGVVMGYEPQCEIHLQEPGKFAFNKLVATLGGKAALHPFKKGDLVAVCFYFWKYKENDNYVNQLIVRDIKLVKELDDIIYD